MLHNTKGNTSIQPEKEQNPVSCKMYRAERYKLNDSGTKMTEPHDLTNFMKPKNIDAIEENIVFSH